MLKLARRARGHFVTLIEIRMHLIRVKPGHISPNERNMLDSTLDLSPVRFRSLHKPALSFP